MTSITIFDRPCGTGKTSDLINSLASRGKFLIVTPYLDEVERIRSQAPKGVVVETPVAGGQSKLEDIRTLLEAGANIATTHALYVMLVGLARDGLLEEYDVFIDEVPEPIKAAESVSVGDFQHVLQADEWVSVDKVSGQVLPTFKWRMAQQNGATGLFPQIYNQADTEQLFTGNDGELFVLAIPTELLTAGKSLTILTYLSEGSLIRAYLDRCELDYSVDKWDGEAEWRKQAQGLITFEDFNAPARISLSHSGQTQRTKPKDAGRMTSALKNLFARKWKGVTKEDVILTCASSNWFNDNSQSRKSAGLWAKSSFGKWAEEGSVWTVSGGINWLANTTRGSNRYSHCSHAIYLYDQHPKPQIKNYLGRPDKAFSEAYALTELVQWLWRTRIRKGEPITVAIPSDRMKNLLINWLATGEVSAERGFLKKWEREQRG